MAVRANIDRFWFSRRSLALHFRAVEQGHFFQATRAAKDIRIDRIGRGCLAVAAVAARLVPPVQLGLHLALQFFKGALQLVHVHGGAVILGYKSCGWGEVNRDGCAPVHQGRQSRTAGTAERIQHQIAGFGVMLDVLADGVVRLLRPVSVHVIDGRGLGGGDGLVEGLNFVFVSRRVVGFGVLFYKAAQVGVRSGGVVAFRHLGNLTFDKSRLAGEGAFFLAWFIQYRLEVSKQLRLQIAS